MPLYLETPSKKEAYKLAHKNRCAECGAELLVFTDYKKNQFYLSCMKSILHSGISRLYEPQRELNIPSWRKEMENEHGRNVPATIERAGLPRSGALTQGQAMEILKLVYPEVPEPQIVRTAMLCRDFGLHPLMKEVYIIGFFNKKTQKTDYSTVVGIQANRKIAADKKGAFSFLDDCPRAATHEEIVKQFGESSEEERDNLVSICKVQGEHGNTAVGFGLWPKDSEPYGKEKGNTKRNMANIRSERQALDRLPGGTILQGVDVIDTSYAEVPEIKIEAPRKVDTSTGEIIEAGEAREVDAPDEVPYSRFDMDWIREQMDKLKWKGTTLVAYLVEKYHVTKKDSVTEVLNQLTAEQAAEFEKDLRIKAGG